MRSLEDCFFSLVVNKHYVSSIFQLIKPMKSINFTRPRLCLNAPEYNSNLLCTGSYLDDNLFHHVQIIATVQTLTLILDGNLVLNQTTEIEGYLENLQLIDIHFVPTFGHFVTKTRKNNLGLLKKFWGTDNCHTGFINMIFPKRVIHGILPVFDSK